MDTKNLEQMGKTSDQEKQPTPEEKRILGRWKDEQEALEALRNLEQRISEFGEDNKFLQAELERRDQELERLRRLAEQGGAVSPPSQMKEGGPDPFAPTDEELRLMQQDLRKGLAAYNRRVEALRAKIVDNLVTEKISMTRNSEEYARSCREAFYSANKDLIGKELLVGAVSAQVAAENPRVPLHMLLGKIADRTRQELQKLTGGSKLSGIHSEGSDTRGNLEKPPESPGQAELKKTLKAYGF